LHGSIGNRLCLRPCLSLSLSLDSHWVHDMLHIELLLHLRGAWRLCCPGLVPRRRLLRDAINRPWGGIPARPRVRWHDHLSILLRHKAHFLLVADHVQVWRKPLTVNGTLLRS
jgi:hypothetical protein